MLKRFIIFLLAIGAASACVPHKVDLQPLPARAAPEQFYSRPSGGEWPSAWYETFNNHRLSSQIEATLHENFDLRQAFARANQARAMAQSASALRGPELDLTTTHRRTRDDGDTRAHMSQMGGLLSWEIDAFNRLGASYLARRFDEQAANDDIDALRLDLSAQTAEAFYGAIAQRRQLALLNKQIKADSHALDLIRQRHQAGVGTNVEVLQQEGQLAENQSLVPMVQAALRAHENRLDVLMGIAPDAFNRTDSFDRFIAIDEMKALGVPSDLLLNRPDLRALQARLVSADAEIGAAIADRLPRLTLDGSILYADGTGSPGVTTGNLLAGLVQPLIDWGRRKAEVERNRSLYEEKLAAFTQAYLNAIEEVENALYREKRQREFIHRLDKRRQILADTASAAESVYRQGASDYLPVIDAIHQLRAIERQLVVETYRLILHRIHLFRALGGPMPSANEVQE